MSVIREDVVQISYDIQDNPFQELINEINQMKRAIMGATDDGEDGLQDIVDTARQASAGMDDLAKQAKKVGNADVDGLKHSVDKTTQEAKKMNLSFTSLIHKARSLAKVKLTTAFQKLKAVPRTIFNKITGGLHKMKNGFASIKNMSFKRLISNLNQIAGRGLIKGWQGAKKLWSSLKQVGRVSLVGLKTQLTALIPKMQQLGLSAMKAFGRGLKRSILGVTAGIRKLNQMTKTSLLGLGVGVAAVGASAIKAGKSFEAGMSEVQAISGIDISDDKGKKEFEQLTGIAKKMGIETKYSATESAEALKYMAMAGWKTKEMVGGLPGIMNLAAASGEDLGTVSDICTDAMTAFGLSADKSTNGVANATHFANVLAQASSNANTNVGLMGETFKYVAPVAGSLGYDIQDTAIGIGLMANSGIKASQAGTALRSIMSRMAKPTKESSMAMKALHLSLTDSKGNMKSFREVMGDMRKGFSGLTKEQKASYAAMLGGKPAMSGVLALVNSSEKDFNKLAKSIDSADAAYDGIGAAAGQAKIKMDNLQGDIDIFKSSFEGFGISMYESVSNPLRGIVQEATKTVNGLNEAFTKGGFEALPPKIATILSNIVVSLIKNAPKLLEVGIHSLDLFISGMIKNKDSIADSGTKIIMTLVKGLSKYYSKFLSFGITIITNILKGLAKEAPRLVQVMVTSLKDLLRTIRKNAPQFIESGMKIIMELIQGFVQSIPDIIQTAVILINGLLLGIQQNLPQIANSAIYIIFSLIQGIVQVLPMLLTVGLQLIIALAMGILQNIPQLMETWFQIVESIYIAIIDSLPQIVELGAQLIISLVQGMIVYFPMVIKYLWKIVTRLISVLTDIDTWKEVGSNIISNIKDGIANGVKSLFGGGEEAAEETKEGFTSGMSDFTFEMPQFDTSSMYSNGHSGGQRYFDGMNAGMTGTELIAPNIDTSSYYPTGRQGIQELNRGIEDELSKSKPRMSTDFGLEKLGIQSVDTTGVQNSFQQVISASNQMQTDVTSSVQTVNQATSELSKNTGFSDLSNSAKKSMKSINTSTTQGMNQMRSTVARGLNGVVSNFRSSMASVRSIVSSTNLYTTGQNIVSGLINGINSKKQQLIETAKAMGNAIETATNKKLDIHSPSRVMKQTGANVVLGTKIGMEDTFGELRKTSQKMGTHVKEDTEKKVTPQSRYSPSNTSTVHSRSSNSTVIVHGNTYEVHLSGSVDRQTEFKLKKLFEKFEKEKVEQMKRLHPRLREV